MHRPPLWKRRIAMGTFPESWPPHVERFGDGPTPESHIHFRHVRKANLEYVRKAHRRLQSWSRRLARAERTERRLYFGELPDSPDSCCYAPSTIEGDEDDYDCGAFSDRADLRDQLSQTCSSITAESWSQMPHQSWQTSCWEHS